VNTYRGHSRIHHGGNIDGFSAMVSMLPRDGLGFVVLANKNGTSFSAMVSMLPRDGLGFVVLANKNGTSLPELLIRHAADLILELEPKDWISLAAERIAKGEEVEEEAERDTEISKYFKRTGVSFLPIMRSPLRWSTGIMRHSTERRRMTRPLWI